MIETAEREQTKSERLPKWLKKVQENSWEGEILISGGAIFSLFQVSNFLASQKVFFSENAPFIGLDETLIFSILAVEGVTFSFILHLFLRGLWIALLCVNAAFPTGVNVEKLRLSNVYLDRNAPVTLTSQIVGLDRVCGLIFYSGFAYVMIVLGLLTTWAFLMPFALFLPGSQIVLLVFLSVYFLDAIFGGPLRRNNMIGKLYRPIYLLFNVVTLAFLYRKTMQVVFSNVRRLHATLLMLLFIPATLALAYLSVYQVLHLPNPFDWRTHPGTTKNPGVLYADKLYLDQVGPEDNIRWFAIQSEVIHGDYLETFVVYRTTIDYDIERQNATSFDQILTVTLDGDTVRNIDWFNSVRPEADQKGLTGIVNIENIKPGKHLIELTIDSDYFRKSPPMKIPFWKE